MSRSPPSHRSAFGVPQAPAARLSVLPDINDGAPAQVVREWADALAIVPRIDGSAEGHILVLPCSHTTDFTTEQVVRHRALARRRTRPELGGRWNYHTSCGPDATQTAFPPRASPSSAAPTMVLPCPGPARLRVGTRAMKWPLPSTTAATPGASLPVTAEGAHDLSRRDRRTSAGAAVVCVRPSLITA